MRFISIFVLGFLIVFNVSAQQIRILVKPVNGKYWGYVDESGNFIEAKYLYVEPFSSDGFAIVYSSARKQYKILNRFGRTVETEITGFDLKDLLGYYPGEYSGGVLVMRIANKWGAMDTTGKVVIPMKWESLLEFENGYGIGKLKNQFYIINFRTGKETVLNDQIIEMKPFHEGLAPCKFKNGKEGFIDTSANIVIKPEFLQVGYFINGIAWAKHINGLIGYINITGEWVIEPQFNYAKNLDPVSGLALVKQDQKWLYVSLKNELIDFGISENTDDFHDGLARGMKDGLYGFFNNQGEWVIKPQFISARDFRNGYAAVSINKEKLGPQIWGFIDTHGKWLIEPIYEKAKDVIILNQASSLPE
jgi:hypothetical protein